MTPEAGWYPDETDERLARYWDGSAWTDQTQPRGEVVGVTQNPEDDYATMPPDAPMSTTRLADDPRATVRAGRWGPAWSTHPRTLISAFFVTAALLVGAVVVLTGDEASATEVALESAGSDGTDPFMDSIATDTVDPDGIEPGGVQQISTSPDQPVATITGNTPGLYGGTSNDTVCDPTALVDFLDNHPDKARAFATVQGIIPDGIADFVATLTPVLLREDTRVTNHGFNNGDATPLQSVLQAGTAVLVDNRGVPRVRCACGNPLTEPARQTTNLTFTGTTWNNFDNTRLVAVQPSPRPLDTLTITDITTGQTQDITTGSSSGTGGSGGVVLATDGLGVVDFGASADAAIAALTEALGEPDVVRDIPGAAGNTTGEACLGGVEQANGVRYAEWGRLRIGVGNTVGLYVWHFTLGPDTPDFPLADSELETPEGLGQDMTRAEFEAAYGPVTVERTAGVEDPAEGESENDIEDLKSADGYEAIEVDGVLSSVSALSRPSNEVCVGADGFHL